MQQFEPCFTTTTTILLHRELKRRRRSADASFVAQQYSLSIIFRKNISPKRFSRWAVGFVLYAISCFVDTARDHLPYGLDAPDEKEPRNLVSSHWTCGVVTN